MENRTLMPTAGRRMFSPLASLRHEMDKLFNEWLASPDFEPMRGLEGNGGFMPRINVTEREHALEVTAELPGVERNDIEIELTKTALILKGQKNVEMEEKREGYLHHERSHGAFYREIALPWEVDARKVSADATFADGVLKVTVPKPKEAPQTTRKIAIHS